MRAHKDVIAAIPIMSGIYFRQVYEIWNGIQESTEYRRGKSKAEVEVLLGRGA